MFYTDTDDWCSISEAYSAFSFAAAERPDLRPEEGSTSPETPKTRREKRLQEEWREATQLAKAFRSLRKFGILLPSGSVARATGALVSMPALKGSKTTHVDLLVGTVGSGTFWDIYSDEDPALHKIELERRYGIFLGCPVMVNSKEVDEAIRSVFPWQTAGFDLSFEQQAKRDEAVNVLTEPRRRPGPKGRHDGLFRHMVRKHLAARIAQGDYVGKKRKDAYLDAVEWLKELTDEDVPIDTVEDWVRPLFESTEVGNNSNSKGPIANPPTSGR